MKRTVKKDQSLIDKHVDLACSYYATAYQIAIGYNLPKDRATDFAGRILSHYLQQVPQTYLVDDTGGQA